MAIILFNIYVIIGAVILSGSLFWYYQNYKPNK